MDDKTADRIRGAILGSACANSLGGTAVGLNHKEILESLSVVGQRNFIEGLPKSFLPDHKPGEILADTYLAMDLAESLIAHDGKFDKKDLKERYSHLLEDAKFLRSAPGAPCLAGLRKMVDGLDPAGNGSLEAVHDHGAARAYPVGCLPPGETIVDVAVNQAKLSQSDSRVWAAAAVIADSVSEFIQGHRLEDENGVRAYVAKELELANEIDPRFAESWDDVAPDLDYMHPATDIPYSLVNVCPEVNEAIPTSVGIFLIFRHNLEEAVCAAASAGGDTDTAAAIVGALSGAYHGASAIPERWLEKIEDRQRLESIAKGLIELW